MFARIIVSVALALLFAGCASYDNGYRDGAYYRPAHGSEGDYYYGRPVPQNRGYYSPNYGPYGAPFYYSPYPYYRPYRYRPYYGPYHSSYYRSGFGASYAYGGFSGYRDYGHTGFGLGFVYSDHDRNHDRGRHDRHDRDDRDDHDRSDRYRGGRRSDRSDRFGVAPISEGNYRSDARQRRPIYADERREFERPGTRPAPRPRVTPQPAASVRLPPGGSRVVQMRRVDTDQANGKNRFKQPVPGPSRAPIAQTPPVMRADMTPVYRGAPVERQSPRRERNASTPPATRPPVPMSGPQRGLNERTRDGGKKPRSASHLENSGDELNE